MPAPPSFRKVNPADQPILYLSLSSKTLPLYAVDEFAETRLAQTISTIRGVAQVQVFGSQKYAVRVQVDPDKLVSRSLGMDDVASAIRNANVNLPTGTLYGPNKAFTIQAERSAHQRRGLPAGGRHLRNGSARPDRGVGRAIDSVENDKTAAWSVDTARGRARRPEAARRQHRRGLRRGEGAHATLPRGSSRRRWTSTCCSTAPRP